MTNGEKYNSLTEGEKKAFREKYENNPLNAFINWKKFYESEDTDVLNFVECVERFKDNQGETVFYLGNFTLKDTEFKLMFSCANNDFYKIIEAENEINSEFYMIDTNDEDFSERAKSSAFKGILNVDLQQGKASFTLSSGDSLEFLPTSIEQAETITIKEELREYTFSKTMPLTIRAMRMKGMVSNNV